MCQANLVTLTHLVLFRGQGRAWPCSKRRTRSVLGTMQLSEFLLHVLNTSGQLSILEKGINTTLMKLQLSYDKKFDIPLVPVKVPVSTCMCTSHGGHMYSMHYMLYSPT